MFSFFFLFLLFSPFLLFLRLLSKIINEEWQLRIMTFPLLLHKCALNTISKKPILLYFVTKYGTGTIEFSRKRGYYHYGIGIFKACLISKFSRKRKQLLSRILKLHIWQCIFLQDFGWLKPSFLRNHPYPKKKKKNNRKKQDLCFAQHQRFWHYYQKSKTNTNMAKILFEDIVSVFLPEKTENQGT